MTASHAIHDHAGSGSSQQSPRSSSIGEILDRGAIITDLQVSSKKKLLEQTAQLFAEHLPGVDASQIFNTLIERENLGSTGIGHGVAIPHGRIEGLDEVTGIFLHLEEALEFDAADHLPVDLVFAILVPQHATEDHLRLLAGLAGIFRDQETRDKLAATSDAAMIRDIFNSPAKQDTSN